jgi:hypothetical protein
MGFVVEVSPTNESRTIKIKRKNSKNIVEEINVPLTFRNLTIEFTDEDFRKHNIECKIIENLLYSHQRDLGSNELKALYIDFKIRNKDLKNGTQPFKDALRSDRYFNALRIKFGYAITCHKAQGGEWTNTFLNCKTSMGYFNSTYFRWLYTGITRAKENLFTLDEPHFKIGSNLQPPKNENIVFRNDILVLNNEILETEIPFDFSGEIPFLRNIFFAVNDILKDSNLEINSIKHTNYLEHYTFCQDNEIAVFKIHYNNHSKITTIEKPTSSNTFVETIYSILTQLENKIIVVSHEKTIESENEKQFEFEKSVFKEFYESILVKTRPQNIKISNVEHKQYHEIYEFKKNGFVATYKFHYNGQGRFGNYEIIQNRTTGLTDEINELLKQATN